MITHKKTWTLPRHTSDWQNINNLVELIKSSKFTNLSPTNKKSMWEELNTKKKASARNKLFKADSINHRFEMLEFFMLGYTKTNKSDKSFLFSPLEIYILVI